MADPLFKKEICIVQSQSLGANRKNEWFDEECSSAKSKYKQAFRVYNESKTFEHRVALADCKSIYKKTINRKKRQYKYKETQKLMALRNAKPRDFWKLFKTERRTEPNILPDDFKVHFKGLFSNTDSSFVEEAENFNINHDFDENDRFFPELDEYILVNEVEIAIKALNNNKASSHDKLINEYFKASADILSSHLADIFNIILDSGHFPESWSKGVIVPVFKKGDINSVENYRGITSIS